MKRLKYTNGRVIGDYPDDWVPPPESDIAAGLADGSMQYVTIPEVGQPFEQKVAAFEARVQYRLDAAARGKGYDDIKSAAIRAGYAGPFHDEGLAFAQWMDATWAKCYEILNAVAQGKRAEPTWDEIVAELPAVPK